MNLNHAERHLTWLLADALVMALSSGCDAGPVGGVDGGGGGGTATGGGGRDDAGTAADGGVVGPAPEVLQLALGLAHTCALIDGGTVRCWGTNAQGQCGLGQGITSVSTPTEVPGLTDVVEIAAGGNHTCVRRSGNGVRCWGAGAQGQLGTGNTNTLYSPPPTDFISDATQSAAGGEHTCVRLSDGTVKCVGSNAFGQLGIGCTTSNLTSPGDAVMNLSGVARVVAGGSHTCALLSDATVRCWGDDRSGQTGASQLLIPNNKYCQATPIRVITGITVLSLGGNHTCAHASDTRCWGSGASGQLGIGVVGTDYPAPTTGPALINTVQLVSGTAHTCARLSSAGVSCWGANTFGELGSGSNTSSANAVGITQALWVGAMVSGTSAVELAAGGNHTCARRSDGAVLCWGRNLDGELGDGTTMNRNVPTPVVWQAP